MQRCEEIHGQLTSDIKLPVNIRRPVRWLHNRGITVALAFLITFEALNIEPIMQTEWSVWMRQTFYNTHPKHQYYNARGATPGMPLCNQINQTVAVLALLTAWALCWLRSLFRWGRLVTEAWEASSAAATKAGGGAAAVSGKTAAVTTATGGAKATGTASTQPKVVPRIVGLMVWQSEESPTRSTLITCALSTLRVLLVDPVILWFMWWLFMVLVNGYLLYMERLFVPLVE